MPDSIRIHYTDGVIPYELGKLVARKSCIVICCLDFPYTVGLTTLVEAFALGIPVICSRNPNFEIDIDKEGIGITVEYNDVQGWIDAIRYIADHPEKAPQIRKFMNYYLPTTLKLLGSYQRLSAQNVKGENITSTLFNIAGMMHTVADAFEKQLDSLYAEEAMDISADITVFETLLKQEGFVDEDKQEQEEAKK